MTSDAEYKSNKARSLIFGGSSATVSTESKGGRLISRMNEDALAAIDSKRRDLTPVMRRLGQYEIHEEDYQQLHIWARQYTEYGEPNNALDIANRLASSGKPKIWLQNGRIVTANFHFKLTNFTTESIKMLDLSKVPNLTELDCGGNELSVLNLSNVPKLTKLVCIVNKLKGLDLADVPSLEMLACDTNKLTKLDLSNVQKLIVLNCARNQITHLDFSHTPLLTSLYCQKNQLSVLDVRKCPNLEKLRCDNDVKIIKDPKQIIKVDRE